MIKRLLIWTLATLGVLLLAFAIWVFWPEQDNLDQLLDSGDPYDAEIVRDEWGCRIFSAEPMPTPPMVSPMPMPKRF